MEETEKILLNGSRSKASVNANSTLNLDLRANRRLLPEDPLDESVDAYDVYMSERSRSNRFRLIFNIRPYCTNVLFNPFTEVVKFEGGDSAFCLNFSESTTGELEEELVDKCSILVKRVTEGGDSGCTGVLSSDSDFRWNAYEAIRDTQLSNEACGFLYHNGLDIFNNHILRNKTFKSVMLSDESFKEVGQKYDKFIDGTEIFGKNFDNVPVYDSSLGSGGKIYLNKDFNTIDDYLRDKEGIIVSESLPKVLANVDDLDYKPTVLPLHLYQKFDVRDFDECYSDKILEDNGWYGFSNDSSLAGMFSEPSSDTEDKIITGYKENFGVDNSDLGELCEDPASVNLSASIDATYELRKVKKDMNINKVMNNEPYCAFIDMYPTRDLFSFIPIWNGYRKRLERNWDYCLTYPSKSTTKEYDASKMGFSGDTFVFFKDIEVDGENTVALKALMYDEYQVMDDGVKALTIYSICQHGLQEGDTVNIYKGNDVMYDTAMVLKVVDKYTFQVSKEDFNMADAWIMTAGTWNMYEPTYEGHKVIPTNGKVIRYTTDMEEVSFKRVVNGVECEYYVRVFSRLPNFKFANREINDHVLYSENSGVIDEYSQPHVGTNGFENHIASMGYAETTYADSDAEIVYTDSIDVDYLKDNIGRPLSDIFLTIVKNNRGYMEWYGRNHDTGNEKVEYSHCFGKVNCGFLLSDFYRYIEKSESRDVRDINSYDGRGLSSISNDVSRTDDIVFLSDRHYYGDIVCYSPLDCDEQPIQECMHRFNTVQRELNGLSSSLDIAPFFDGNIKYDTVIRDEDSIPYSEVDGFFNGSLPHSSAMTMGGMCSQDEGYYYQAHYSIPIKTVSQSVKNDGGVKYDTFSCTSGTNSVGRNYIVITTESENGVSNGDVLTMYDKKDNKIYFLIVDNMGIRTGKSFRCFIRTEKDERVNDVGKFFDNGIFRKKELTIMGRTEDIPFYAKVVKDGSCRYYWREILANGTEDDAVVYPFTNGSFYIREQINFYLRRQDPSNTMISIKWGEKSGPTEMENYPPVGEDVASYPALDADEYFEDNEIKEC